MNPTNKYIAGLAQLPTYLVGLVILSSLNLSFVLFIVLYLVLLVISSIIYQLIINAAKANNWGLYKSYFGYILLQIFIYSAVGWSL